MGCNIHESCAVLRATLQCGRCTFVQACAAGDLFAMLSDLRILSMAVRLPPSDMMVLSLNTENENPVLPTHPERLFEQECDVFQ